MRLGSSGAVCGNVLQRFVSVLRGCSCKCLQTMAYTVDDVVGLLNEDGSYIDSSDDDLGFEIDPEPTYSESSEGTQHKCKIYNKVDY